MNSFEVRGKTMGSSAGVAVLKGLVLAAVLAGGSATAEASEPAVPVTVQYVEATTQAKTFDKRLVRFKTLFAPYTGAKLLDRINTKVEPGSSVTLRFKGAPPIKISMMSLDRTKGLAKVKYEVPSLKFSTRATHKRGDATFIVRLPPDKQKPHSAMLFAVTTTL